MLLKHLRKLRKSVHIVCLGGNGPGVGKNVKGLLIEALLDQITRFEMSAVIHHHQQHHNESRAGKELLAEKDFGVESKGQLYSIEPVCKLFGLTIESLASQYRLILSDGFPRDVRQVGELIGSGVPFTYISLNLTREQCIARVNERAIILGENRVDDETAGDRFDLSSRNIPAMKRLVKQYDPNAWRDIDASLPIEQQLGKILKVVQLRNGGLTKFRWQQVIAKLNNPQHEASKILANVKAKRPALWHHQQNRPAHMAEKTVARLVIQTPAHSLGEHAVKQQQQVAAMA